MAQRLSLYLTRSFSFYFSRSHTQYASITRTNAGYVIGRLDAMWRYNLPATLETVGQTFFVAVPYCSHIRTAHREKNKIKQNEISNMNGRLESRK